MDKVNGQFDTITVFSFLHACSAKKKDSDLAAAVSRASGLEGQLNKSEAALSTAQSQNAALTSELADVKCLLAKVCTVGFLFRKKEGRFRYGTSKFFLMDRGY